MIFHTKARLGRIGQCACVCVCVREDGVEVNVSGFTLKLNQAFP